MHWKNETVKKMNNNIILSQYHTLKCLIKYREIYENYSRAVSMIWEYTGETNEVHYNFNRMCINSNCDSVY